MHVNNIHIGKRSSNKTIYRAGEKNYDYEYMRTVLP